MSGLFLAAVADFASSAGHRPERARALRALRRYALRERCELLVEACTRVMPRDPLRVALRRLSRGAPRTLVGSIVGRVVLGSVEGPLEIFRAGRADRRTRRLRRLQPPLSIPRLASSATPTTTARSL